MLTNASMHARDQSQLLDRGMDTGNGWAPSLVLSIPVESSKQKLLPISWWSQNLSVNCTKSLGPGRRIRPTRAAVPGAATNTVTLGLTLHCGSAVDSNPAPSADLGGTLAFLHRGGKEAAPTSVQRGNAAEIASI